MATASRPNLGSAVAGASTETAANWDAFEQHMAGVRGTPTALAAPAQQFTATKPKGTASLPTLNQPPTAGHRSADAATTAPAPQSPGFIRRAVDYARSGIRAVIGAAPAQPAVSPASAPAAPNTWASAHRFANALPGSGAVVSDETAEQLQPAVLASTAPAALAARGVSAPQSDDMLQASMKAMQKESALYFPRANVAAAKRKVDAYRYASRQEDVEGFEQAMAELRAAKEREQRETENYETLFEGGPRWMRSPGAQGSEED